MRKLIPNREALPPQGEPVQDPVLTYVSCAAVPKRARIQGSWTCVSRVIKKKKIPVRAEGVYRELDVIARVVLVQRLVNFVSFGTSLKLLQSGRFVPVTLNGPTTSHLQHSGAIRVLGAHTGTS